jgi:uncharacterized protein (TIGR02611 family)
MRRRIRKTFVTFIGSLVLIMGIVMIPYPGPGWLVVFAGLGILSTEYVWAKKLLKYAKSKYDAWQKWVEDQSDYVKSLIWIGTSVIVIITIWLVNGYGIINDVLNLGWDWVRSPLPIFHK